MINDKIILQAIPNVLQTIDVPGLGEKHQGKVRDFYILKDERIIITTDRQSAFDLNLGFTPYKGAVLNQLAAFWFEQTKHIVPNHMIEVPDSNVLIAQNCIPIPIEMIVRGYISGVTTTSIWHSYQNGERHIYGQQFPDGLKKNEKLIDPVITPTTHGGGKDGHDERLTENEMLDNHLIDKDTYERMKQISLQLFEFGSKRCDEKGLILVDTKYEFGFYNGEIMLMDEIHTPDSSRFWAKDTYQQRFDIGEEPENFDKEFIRLWYTTRMNPYKETPPSMPPELMVAASQRYMTVYEKITGKPFDAFAYPIEERIKKNVKKYTNRSSL